MTEEQKEQRKSYFLNYASLESDFASIDKLCFKAKFMLFKYMCVNNDFTLYEAYESCYDDLTVLTPIEQILNVAFWIYDIDVNSKQGISMSCQLGKQENIICNNKTYFVDFIIEGYEQCEVDNDTTYSNFYALKNPLIIECDGFDYHSSKKQMAHDYERENNLKLAGYDIMRFTGSQIYNEPMKCVEQVVEYIKRNSRRTI